MSGCARCGRENAAEARFCDACGAALAKPRLGREERKRVSVLFADLVGFTSAAENLDPEDVRAVLRPYHERLRAELERHGGTVEKFIGDAVMALFGAPVAHEDDPERAVRAGLAIRDAIVGEGRLRVRVGITTGEVVVSLDARPEAGEPMAAGDVVNTAARLQAGAAVDAVLVDETTARATERVVEYRGPLDVSAKGKAEPIRAWEAVTARSARGVDVRGIGGGPLVGREAELAVLEDLLASASSAASLVTLVGVPGIGKTRLVSELRSRAPEAAVWRQGRSFPYAQGAYAALGDIVKLEAGMLETDDPMVAEAKLRESVAALSPPDRDWVYGHLRPLVGLGSDLALSGDRRAESFAAWRHFVEAVAARAPLVLVFEDLHWADDGLLDFIDYLVEAAAVRPILVVATARPELLTRRPGWGGGKPNTTLLSLAALSDEDTARLVHALLERATLPQETQQLLLANAAGNPLYAEEFVRLAREQGDLTARPESVQAIIAARIDALPVDEKALVQDASVVGKVFWAGALASMSEAGRWAIEDRLQALERREFVRRLERSLVAGETEYVFRHALIQDVAYTQLTRAERARRHEAVADWLERVARPEDHADALAHHYGAALALAAAAGAAAERLAVRARRAFVAAADRAYALHAFAAAAAHYERALDFEGDDGDARLLFRFGRSLANASDPSSAARAPEVLARAADALAASGDRDGAVEAHLEAAKVHGHRVEPNLADVHVRRAEELVGDDRSSRAAALVLAQKAASASRREGDPAAGLALAEDALALAEAHGLDTLRTQLLSMIVAPAKHELGLPGWREDLEQGLEIALAADSDVAVGAANNLAAHVYDEGDVAGADAMHAEARRVAERFGRLDMVRFLRGWQPVIEVAVGRWDDALSLADASVADYESGTPSFSAIWARSDRAVVRFARDDPTGALEDVAAAIALARASGGAAILLAYALARAARLHAELGATEAAVACIDEVLARPAQDAGFSSSLPDLAWGALLAGRAEAAHEFLARIERPSLWLRAAHAIARGDVAVAATDFEAIGSVADEAYARLRAAEADARAARWDDADDQLDQAAAFFRTVRATRYVREAERIRDAIRTRGAAAAAS